MAAGISQGRRDVVCLLSQQTQRAQTRGDDTERISLPRAASNFHKVCHAANKTKPTQ